MPELISAHGGCGLISRVILSEKEKARCLSEVSGAKTYIISEGDISVFYRIADGTLSPLEGPMEEEEFYRVLDEEVIERNGKKYAWTIPIAFPVSEKESKAFNTGETVVVKSAEGKNLGLLEITDIYYFDKDKYNRAVYGTDRKDHPGPRIFNTDYRNYLLGGRITAFGERRDNVNKYMVPPNQCRKIFKEKEWGRIIAFQTRNPLHRAHEYAMVYSAETFARQNIFAGIVLNPLVGETKSDDIPAAIRMRTYEVLLSKRLIGNGDKNEALWKDKGYDLCDNLLLIALDMRMYYAGPREAVMHAIYRQNSGFTDIIIGRRHADAPFDDGVPIWGDFDAQAKFENLNGQLLIKPFKVGTAAYFEELGRVALVDEFKHKGYTQLSLSGKELRRKLEHGEPIDERIMRKAIVDILYDAYRKNIGEFRSSIKSKNIRWHESGIVKEDRENRNRHRGAVIWLTGLPSSGKSTVAVGLQRELFKMGCSVFILDGDNIRHGLNKDLGFSPQDREENIRRIGEVAKLFAEAGFLIITAFVSPYRKDRELVRSLMAKNDFVEVYVKADLAVCEKRDLKGLYKKAREGAIKEFTGVSAPYEEPLEPELVLDTDMQAEDESVSAVLNFLKENKYIQLNY